MERLYESGIITLTEPSGISDMKIIENTRGNFFAVTAYPDAANTAQSLAIVGIKKDQNGEWDVSSGTTCSLLVFRNNVDDDAVLQTGLDDSDETKLVILSGNITVNAGGSAATTVLALGIEAYDGIAVYPGDGQLKVSITLAIS